MLFFPVKEDFCQNSRKIKLGKNDIYGQANFKCSENFSVECVASFKLTRDESERYQRVGKKCLLRDGLIWKEAGEIFNMTTTDTTAAGTGANWA